MMVEWENTPKEQEEQPSSTEHEELRADLQHLQAEIAAREATSLSSENEPAKLAIIAGLEALQKKVDSSSELYAEIQQQLDALRQSPRTETDIIKEVSSPVEGQDALGVGWHELPAGITSAQEFVQQAQANKHTIASDYEHIITEKRQTNNRLPKDRFSQKILQPTLGALLQRISSSIKNTGR